MPRHIGAMHGTGRLFVHSICSSARRLPPLCEEVTFDILVVVAACLPAGQAQRARWKVSRSVGFTPIVKRTITYMTERATGKRFKVSPRPYDQPHSPPPAHRRRGCSQPVRLPCLYLPICLLTYLPRVALCDQVSKGLTSKVLKTGDDEGAETWTVDDYSR